MVDRAWIPSDRERAKSTRNDAESDFELLLTWLEGGKPFFHYTCRVESEHEIFMRRVNFKNSLVALPPSRPACHTLSLISLLPRQLRSLIFPFTYPNRSANDNFKCLVRVVNFFLCCSLCSYLANVSLKLNGISIVRALLLSYLM